ncbi:MAG: hypothetical protein ACYDFU_09595, partial [Nitrospirota bacterium]
MQRIKTAGDYALEAKEDIAHQIIKQALEKAENIFALYLGDKASRVLLHMLKQYGGGKISIPVINFQFLPLQGERLRFMDKLRRMWSLDLEVVRFPEKLGGGSYTEGEVAEEMSNTLTKMDVGSVLSSRADFFEGDIYCKERQGYTEFRPLCGFSAEDVSAYIKRHRLPICSLDSDSALVPGRSEGTENKEVADKLR